jgi:hypothetical protein
VNKFFKAFADREYNEKHDIGMLKAGALLITSTRRTLCPDARSALEIHASLPSRISPLLSSPILCSHPLSEPNQHASMSHHPEGEPPPISV